MAVLHRFAPLANPGKPTIKLIDIRLERRSLWSIGSRRRGLVVARQPFRTLRHCSLHGLAVLYRNVRDHCDLLCLYAGSVAFYDPAKKNFLEAAFPRFTEIAVYQASLSFVYGLMTVAVEFLRLL